MPVAGIMLVVHVAIPPHAGIVGGDTLRGADLGWVTILGMVTVIPLGVLTHFVAQRLNRREFTMLSAAALPFANFGQADETGTGTGTGAGMGRRAAGSVGGPRTGTLTATEAPPSAGTILALILAFFLPTVRRGWSLAHTGEVMEAALPIVGLMWLLVSAIGI